MASENNYQLGLLYLSHILISADGVISDEEQKALQKIREEEKIPATVYEAFQRDVKTKRLSEIYQRGLDLISNCTLDEKKNAFIHLFKICAADGNIHVKEARLLLYSAKMTDAHLSEIMAVAEKRQK